MKTIPARTSDVLNRKKFTAEEIAACRWLEDSGVFGWMVDLLDKSVIGRHKRKVGKFDSLIEFAKAKGYQK